VIWLAILLGAAIGWVSRRHVDGRGIFTGGGRMGRLGEPAKALPVIAAAPAVARRPIVIGEHSCRVHESAAVFLCTRCDFRCTTQEVYAFRHLMDRDAVDSWPPRCPGYGAMRDLVAEGRG